MSEDKLASMLDEESYFRREAEASVDNLQADNAILRKQIFAYQQDLEICRRVLYFVMSHGDSPRKVISAAERCLRELKQK